MNALTDWELLRILLETARAGSFRKAAATMGLTQPTVGRKIDQLEGLVGARLLVRTKTGISLTQDGDYLFRVAEEMERTARKAAARIAETKSQPAGTVRIAVTDGMAGYWLPRRLRRFHRENPRITLDVTCIDAKTEVDLSNREADITVMYRFPTDQDVVVLEESEMVLAPMCTKQFIEDWGRPTSIEEVLNFPVITHPMHFAKMGEMRPWAEMLERHPMIVYRTASSVVLGLVARMGLGISLQPLGVLDREDYAVMLNLDGFRCRLPFFLVCHRAVKDVPAVRLVIQYLQDSLFKDDDGGPSRR
jgi:DNA-binding transcriptional LysR family regulator